MESIAQSLETLTKVTNENNNQLETVNNIVGKIDHETKSFKTYLSTLIYCLLMLR